jgi:hypothetical protein
MAKDIAHVMLAVLLAIVVAILAVLIWIASHVYDLTRYVRVLAQRITHRPVR